MEKYKGCIIEPGYVGYQWYHEDDYDVDCIDGEFVSLGTYGHGNTVQECKDRIDEILDEQEREKQITK